MTHIVHPAGVGTNSSEDGGFLGIVAAHAGAKAHHSVDIPGAVRVLTVQGTAGVSLKDKKGEKNSCNES